MHDELFLKIQLKLFSNKLDNKISQKVLSLQDSSTVAENEKFPFHDRRSFIQNSGHSLNLTTEQCISANVFPRRTLLPENCDASSVPFRGSWQRHVIPLAHHANAIPPRNGTTPFGFSTRPAITPGLETEWLVTLWTSATYRASHRCHFKRLSFLGTRASSVSRRNDAKKFAFVRDGDGCATRRTCRNSEWITRHR